MNPQQKRFLGPSYVAMHWHELENVKSINSRDYFIDTTRTEVQTPKHAQVKDGTGLRETKPRHSGGQRQLKCVQNELPCLDQIKYIFYTLFWYRNEEYFISKNFF